MDDKKWLILIGGCLCVLFGNLSWLIAYIIVLVCAKLLSLPGAKKEIKALFFIGLFIYGYYKWNIFGIILALFIVAMFPHEHY